MVAKTRHAYFPPDSFARHVQDTLGDDVLRRLCKAIGGQDIRFPKPPSVLLDDHRLVQAVGRDDGERLYRVFAGETVYVPKLPLEYLCATLVEEGLSNKEIAMRINVSDRHVRRCLSALGITNSNPLDRGQKAVHPDRVIKTATGPVLIAAE